MSGIDPAESIRRAGGESNPEYVNARVRARRRALLDDDDYRKLIRMGPGEIARFMEETEYEREMNALGARYDGVDLIEYALNQNLAKHFDDLLDWANGELYGLIASYLRKFDAWNAKTVIRGVYSGADPAEIDEDLIRAGEFDDALLDRLVEADSVETVVELLRPTIFGPDLPPALEQFREEGVLVPLENAIDRTFYEHLLDGLRRETDNQPRKLYLEFLQAEIDFRNARNALRIARSGADIEPASFFIEGGVLFTQEDLAGLMREPEALVEHLSQSRYGTRIADAIAGLDEQTSLIQFEHALEAAQLRFASRLSNVNPIAVTSALSYILSKEREVENIRAIARGKEVGLTSEEIERELVIT